MSPADHRASRSRRLASRSLAMILLLLLAAPLAGQTPPAAVRFTLDPAASRVWFEASANLGGVPGEARQVEGWAEAAETTAFHDARGAITVQVASIQTGIALRDRHLREEMAAGSYPVIRFVLDRIQNAGAPAGGGERAVTLHGALTIRGATRPVAIPAAVAGEGRGMRVRGELPLRLSEYGIEPPVRLAGLARMRDEMTVHFDVLFAPAQR